VQVRQARHQSSRVQLVHLLLEQSDAQHLPVHAHPLLYTNVRVRRRLLRRRRHLETPDIRARTSNTTAKSFFSQPIPRAPVRNSLLAAVVGIGTFSCRPSSIASSMSFCIMFTSNHASSGMRSTNGPRY